MSTTSKWEENLANRPASKIKSKHSSDSSHVIYHTPCDLGVIRNGGKRGAKHGPMALMAPFQNLTVPETFHFQSQTFQAPSANPDDFEQVQKEECQFFEKELTGTSIIHLGGGHDHAYPFARALLKEHKGLVVINVDAHLDTRPDPQTHSGTPFRQLHLEFGEQLHLLQVGIHSFANGSDNFEAMGNMKILDPVGPALSPSSLKESISDWLEPFKDKDLPLFLSVDCDGLDASYMPAVSAPNHRGLSQAQFSATLESCQDFWAQSNCPRALGLYEFNPLYDELSQKAARYLAAVMHDFFINPTHGDS